MAMTPLEIPSMNPICTNITVPIFNTNFTVVKYTDKNQLSDFIGARDVTKFDAFVTYINDDIHVFFDTTNVISQGVIAHESKHIVNFIFKEIDYLIDMDNDEVECYLLGWVVNEINKFLNER